MPVEFYLQSGNQLAILRVDRTLPAEMAVMLGDREHSLPRHILSAKHIFEEGNDFVVRFRCTTGHHQECVIVHTASFCLAGSGEHKFGLDKLREKKIWRWNITNNEKPGTRACRLFRFSCEEDRRFRGRFATCYPGLAA